MGLAELSRAREGALRFRVIVDRPLPYGRGSEHPSMDA